MTQTFLTREDELSIIAEYSNDVPITVLANKYHVCHVRITSILKTAGVHSPKRVVDDSIADQMIRMYQNGLSCLKIARKTGFSNATVIRCLRKRGINRRSNRDYKREGFAPSISESELRLLYVNQQLSAFNIAERFGVCGNTVWNWLKFYGIPPISRKQRAASRPCYGHPSWKGGITPFRIALITRLAGWKRSIKQRDQCKCQRCSATENLEVHHTYPLRQITKSFKESFPGVDISTSEGLDFALKTIVNMHTLEMGITLCEKCHSEVDDWRKRFLKKAT